MMRSASTTTTDEEDEKKDHRPTPLALCVMRGDLPQIQPGDVAAGRLCPRSSLATPFYRFLARFSGRRRSTISYHKEYPPPWQCFIVQLVVVSLLVNLVGACSSRSTPKPRPPAPTPRPNITFLTYPCPPAYDHWFCLNGATCFTVKIQDSLLYNCMCAEGFQGVRCEYKDLDGSYMPSQRRYLLETASIAGGATIAVFSAVILCLAAYLRWRRRKKTVQTSTDDQVDGMGYTFRAPIFGVRHQNHFNNNEPHLVHTPTGGAEEPPPPAPPRGDHQLRTTTSGGKSEPSHWGKV